MALTGDLIDAPLPDLLSFLSSRQRSGWLTIATDELEVVIELLDGRPVAVRSSDAAQRLGSRLVNSGALPRDGLATALECQRRSAPSAALGSLLIEQGQVDIGVVCAALRDQLGELLFQLLIRPTGRFEFARGIPTPRGVVVQLDAEREALRAIVRADAWQAARLARSRLTLASDVTADMLGNAVREDWPVFEALLDGATTLVALARGTGWDKQALAASVSRLQASGVVVVNVRGSQRSRARRAPAHMRVSHARRPLGSAHAVGVPARDAAIQRAHVAGMQSGSAVAGRGSGRRRQAVALSPRAA
jgi:hypothetical protein